MNLIRVWGLISDRLVRNTIFFVNTSASLPTSNRIVNSLPFLASPSPPNSSFIGSCGLDRSPIESPTARPFKMKVPTLHLFVLATLVILAAAWTKEGQ